MSLHQLQLLFSDLTLGRIDLAAIERLASPADARALGYELTDGEVERLRAIDWRVARAGLSAHLGIGETISRAQYLRDPVSGAFQGARYPFPNPPLNNEDNMADPKDPKDPSSLEQPVRYPPESAAAYNPAAVRCAPAVDPNLYNPAAVRCAPAVDPNLYYHPAAVRCAPAVDPNLYYHPAAVRCAPAVDPNLYNPAAVRCAPAVDPNLYHPIRCAPALDPGMYSLFAYGAPMAPPPPVPPAGPSIQLRGAVLRGVDLSGQDLRGADLTGADLTDADLTGADLRGASLAGAILFNAKISKVIWK